MVDHSSSPRPSYSRRLSDKILIAFHQACDQGKLEVARMLLAACEAAVIDGKVLYAGRDRREKETLVTAYARLWELRHIEEDRTRLNFLPVSDERQDRPLDGP